MLVSPERWRQVKSILDTALELPASQRRTFLAEQCGSDEELFREAESLLSASEDITAEHAGFLEDASPLLASVAEAAADVSLDIDSTSDDEDVTQQDAGVRLGAYQLIHEIGRGGMGVVHLAMRADSEFTKKVAIKLIRHGMENEFAIRRFRNERQILATLEHPFIARLLDGGTTDRGLPYFVMEYVEGEPLLRYCDLHSLGIKDRLEMFQKVCSAVHYAHRRLIIHRDLKPGNVLVRQDGTPKLLDFGIAKLLDPDITDNPETTVAGMRLVTPAYASPEQMAGEPATVRSDIYSLGVIFCELVAGCKPLELDARPVAASAVTGQLVRSALPPLSPDLRAVIQRAAARNPRDRYQTVEELMADLASYIEGNAVPHYTAARHPSDYDPQPGSLAILPFRLLTKDTGSDAYLATGITDAIITKLSTVGRISVRPTTAVLRYANSDDSAAAGRELNVEYVLTGTLHRAADRVRASVQLSSVRTGSATWAASFFDELADVLRLEESISDQVAQALIPQLSGEEREQLARRGTNSAKAHEAYLRGRWHWNTHTEEGLARALVYFNEAIAEDGRYAQAHAGIADYYVQLGLFGGMPAGESFAAAKQAAATALDIDPTLAEAHTSYGVALWAYDRDYSQAAHHLQLAITLNPDYETAHQWFGMLNSARGRDEIAIASLERARKLVPRSPAVAVSLARAYINSGQPQRVLDDLTNPARKPDEHPAVPEMLGWAYLFLGRPAEAVAAARQAHDLNPENVLSMAVLAHAESAAGNQSRARALVAEGEKLANSRYVSGYHIASMHLAVGSNDRAIACLRSAWSARDWWAMWTATDPRWDALRHDPRFQQLIEEHMPAASLRAPTQSGSAYTLRRSSKKPARSILPYAALFSALAAGVTWYLTERTINRPAAPFANMRIAKITTDGVATRAAVSPDGSHIAYTKPENGKPVLWLRGQDQSTPTRLTLIDGELSGLEFTGKGRYISYVAYSKNTPAEGVLYRVPIGGGPPLKVMTEVSGPASLSPDGAHVAFLRSNRVEGEDNLYIAQSGGAGERRIATRKYPERFAWTSTPAWSSDGKRLAYSIEGSDVHGFYTYVMVIDVDGRTSRILSKPRWQYVERLSWMADGSGLLAIGQEHESSFQQIWYLPFPGGEPSRISNDLNDYMGVTVTADSRSLISVQVQTLSNVYILKPETSARAVQVTPGSGRYFDLAWTPDDHIVYASDATGSADIWSMNVDGSNQRRLTTGLGRSYAPSVSPDGRSIVFHSNRNGNWNVWRMDRDGANPVALTSDRQDSNWPRFTPDSRFVVYHHTEPNAMWNLWKVPVLGGTPERLTTRLTTRPVVSRDGRIACWFSEEANKPDWKIAILPAAGGNPIRLFDVPETVAPDTALRWTPRGDAITYLDGRKGVSNVWVQPLSGAPARALTDFDRGQIYSFDWASDGRLIFSQGMSTSDVVEIRDESPR